MCNHSRWIGWTHRDEEEYGREKVCRDEQIVQPPPEAIKREEKEDIQEDERDQTPCNVGVRDHLRPLAL